MIDSDQEKPPSPGSLGLPSIAVIDGTGRLEHGAGQWLRDRLASALTELAASGDVRVRVVGDTEMAAAHLRYKALDGTTDVLTFDLSEGGALDVDILICLDEAERQAGARGHSLTHELLLYAVHGVLHCLGHDDHDEAAAARMHAVEDAVLERLGVGATYARPEGAPPDQRETP